MKKKRKKIPNVIKAEELYKENKPRMILRATKKHKSKKTYNRKDKRWKNDLFPPKLFNKLNIFMA